MGIRTGPGAVKTGLILALDASNPMSYNYNQASFTNNFSSGWGWNATATLGQNDPFGGTNAIRITAVNTDPYGQGNAGPGFTVYAGKTYNYSLWMRGEGTALGKNFTLALYDGTAWVSGSWGTNYTITSSWTRISQTFTPSNTGTAQLRLDCPESGGPIAGDVVYLFGLQFSEGSALKPYLPNLGNASPTVWKDVSGNGYDFTIVPGAYTSSLSSAFMNFSGSYGIAKRVVSSALTNVPKTHTGTIMIFSSILNSTGNWRTLTRGSGADHQVIIQNGSNILGLFDNDTGTFISNSFDVSTISNYTTAFNCLHWRFSESSPFYSFGYNGISAGTDITSASATFNNGFCCIGGFHNGVTDASNSSQYWGNISTFLYYDRHLTTEEIRQNFNSIRGRFGL